MPPHKKLQECEQAFTDIKERQDTTNAIIHSIKDNDIKHLSGEVADLSGKLVDIMGKIGNLEGRVWIMIGIMTATFLTIIGTAWAIISGMIK